MGFVTTFGLSAGLAFTSSPTQWWAWLTVAAASAVSLTGLVLMVSRPWRRFGVGFVAGAIGALIVDAVLLVWLLSQVTM